MRQNKVYFEEEKMAGFITRMFTPPKKDAPRQQMPQPPSRGVAQDKAKEQAKKLKKTKTVYTSPFGIQDEQVGTKTLLGQ